MRSFEYAAPKAPQQALGLLGRNWGESEILAGGTDLLALMKDDVVRPRRLVNVKAVEGADLHALMRRQNGLQIGALVSIARVAESADIRQRYPMLANAAVEAASPQIRNMATMGGNICQRPRCWYFRNGFGLLAVDKKTGKSLVLEGDNRYHAILGNEGPAYFVSPSSIVPSLVAYGAKITLASAKGTREVPLEKFFVTPREENQREHDLRPDEMLTFISLPAPPAGARVAHYEVRQKAAVDGPLATCAALLEMSGGTVKTARIVMGHVAPIPWISQEAAQAIAGKPVNEETAEAAGAAAVAQAKSLGRNGYKIKLARVAVKRAILAAAQGGQA
ncbi:MAG: FAD binding domain-containing protein [Acidobacteria bacterium]|nr:FAD binding domain-containing protein [Acidobacteriota bacterium]